MAEVVLENLVKKYGDLQVIHGASLTIDDGEFAVLVGPSGCGKSTLLRMIAGLEDITAGDLRIGGAVMNDVHASERRVAMVFQSYALYPHLTVRGNMEFGLKIQGLNKLERDARVMKAAETLQITDLLDRKPKAMSGGQRQRVAIGRAIVRDPEAFLFDEPLSNLDAKLRVQMRQELTELHQRLQTTMIYVTHDQVEAMTMADKIVVLQGGYVEQVGAPMELYHNPANKFVAGFIGSPAMNFIAGTATNGAFQLPGNKAFKATRDLKDYSGNATLGIRPEHLDYTDAPGDGDLQGTVKTIERLGADSFAYVQCGDAIINIKSDGDRATMVGDKVGLTLDPARAHLFDEAGHSLAR